MRELYKTITERKRPEEVANIIMKKFHDHFSLRESKAIKKAASNSFGRGRYSYSSMSDTYKKPVGAVRQLSKGKDLFPNIEVQPESIADQAHEINEYAKQASDTIFKEHDKNNFVTERLNRSDRQAKGLDISKRQYNKRFRYLKRLKAKSDTLTREISKREFTQIGKTGLATRLKYEDFSSDTNTACFIAYFTSRCNLRSEFTIKGQVRPYDQIADTLFKKCQASDTTNWFAIAHVFPEQHVLQNVSDHQKGTLLGIWYGILENIAEMLSEIWTKSDINRKTMIVKRGNDSTTWNNTASAWNKARDSWIGLNYALGTEEILEEVCFGKALRLMAGDVVSWHLSEGGNLDADTLVWAELPLPWEVFKGNARCGRSDVSAVCKKHGIDAKERGWITPKPKKKVVSYTPTPELVHGVTIAHPGLAKILKSAGAFSGKPKS